MTIQADIKKSSAKTPEPMDRLHLILDILRHEKPVFFTVNPDYNWAALKTGQEPTGEEEVAGV